MAVSAEGLSVHIEWQSAPAIRTPELGATLARLEIWTDGECLTRVEDAETSAGRRSIYVPTYPLAEWIVTNWWVLQHHVRPSLADRWAWSYRNRGRSPRPVFEWLANHNVRAVDDGFAWPDLSVLPEGASTRLVWFRDGASASGQSLRFLSQGEAVLPAGDVRSALAGIVNQTIDRLIDVGIQGSRLQEEWLALGALEQEERDFCQAAARLGLDPLWLGDDVAEVLLDLDQRTESLLLDDFLASLSARQLEAGLDWLHRARGSLTERQGGRPPQSQVPTIGGLDDVRLGQGDRPWTIGYDLAQQVRGDFGLSPVQRVEVADYVKTHVVAGHGPFELDGLGRHGSGGTVVALTRDRNIESRRFAEARAMFHAAVEEHEFLLSEAKTDHQATARAFAAELLAPAEGILELMETSPVEVGRGEAEAIGHHFGVSRLLVEHQVQNQLSGAAGQ